jgi:hypothetical protein
VRALLLLLLVTSCTPGSIRSACDNLRHLHCPAGDPISLPDGGVAQCEDVFSLYPHANVACVGAASSCASADDCKDL